MSKPDFNEQLHFRNDLDDAGKALHDLLVDPVQIAANLGDTRIEASLTQETKGDPGFIRVTAELQSDTLGGLATMLGLEDEFRQLYPNGTTFKFLRIIRSGSSRIKIGNPARDRLAFVGATYGPLHRDVPILLHLEKDELGPDEQEALSKIMTPPVVTASAHFLVRLVKHIQQPI